MHNGQIIIKWNQCDIECRPVQVRQALFELLTYQQLQLYIEHMTEIGHIYIYTQTQLRHKDYEVILIQMN